MVKNHVKVFCSEYSHTALEDKINLYCRKHEVEPISVSMIYSAGTFVALVVMEGR